MNYLVTGATGFIGRNLVERLVRRAGDTGTVYVLVRKQSLARLERLVERCGGADTIVPVFGDITAPYCGVGPRQRRELAGNIDHVFHLAAVYDMAASEEQNERANVGGTRNILALAGAVKARRFHHLSSVAVAGDFDGDFSEQMFDEGQPLRHAYHRTKFESERLVREQWKGPWRVYRPSMVVGDSRNGEIDKVDGPYYFFPLIKQLRRMLPRWVPLVGIEMGHTNIVPVDYVADAIDHLAHKPRLDRRAFHLVNPEPQESAGILDALMRAAGAPQVARRIDRRITAAPLKVLGTARRVPPARQATRLALAAMGMPEAVLDYIGFRPRFRSDDTVRALRGSGIEVPAFHTYAPVLWDFWAHNLDRSVRDNPSLRRALDGRRVIITGGSSGIGRATALKVAAAGGVPLLVARRQGELDQVRQEILAAGGVAYTYPCDLADGDAVDALVERIYADHPVVDMLVNCAGRSIRRSLELSYDRFHDFERTIQLNYYGAIRMILGVLPHMRARGEGHVVNISSLGVQAHPPRFSAYVASKAALDAFTRVAAAETLGDGVTFTTIHMPLVRTPMIAPTRMYDSFPTATPDEAADMVCRALRDRPKDISTPLGTLAEIGYALLPGLVDRIMYTGYRAFPESAAARGSATPSDERPSLEARAFAKVMRGVHW